MKCNSNPRLSVRRVLYGLKNILVIYAYGIMTFILVDLLLFYMFHLNDAFIWRLKITILGLILYSVWLLSWWLLIKWLARR